MTDTTLAHGPELSAAFRGEIIRPEDPEYDAARAVYNASIDRRPAMVLRPHGAADVIDAVNFARDSGLPLTVRCGGHSIAGTSANEGGVLLDLADLKGVHVDPERRTAVAQGGEVWGDYDRETSLYGLATPGGRVTTTGVGGFTLGGGYGWLSPMFGLTCDNLVGADVVTADGRLVHASEDENADLLWGLRGAGANFGVVTAYELKVHPMPPLILAGMLIVPNDGSAEDLAHAYRDFADAAPDQAILATALVLAPPEPFVPPELVGTPVLGVIAGWVGDPAEGESALAPLRAAFAGGMDLMQPMPYTALQQIVDGFNPKGMYNYHRGIHLSALPDAVLDDYLAVGRTNNSPLDQGIIFRNGGAVARVPEDATAASNRSAPYMAHPIACWGTPEESEREMDWVRRFTEAVAPAATGGTYLNFEPGMSSADLEAGFGAEKLARLTALKDAWDPDNLFRSNHNVPPSGWRQPGIPQQTPR